MAHERPRIQTQPREKLGTRYSQRLRDAGRLPVVIYGHGEGNVIASVDTRGFTDALHTGAHLVEVEVEGNATPCLIKDVQYDHLHRHPIHVDFTRVDLSEEVEVEIEVVLDGSPKALEKPGAVMTQPMAMLLIKCRADSIPDLITLDIEGLKSGESITAGEIPLPEGVALSDDVDADSVVCMITEVDELDEDEIPGGEEAEPQVIGRGVEGDEDGDGVEAAQPEDD